MILVLLIVLALVSTTLAIHRTSVHRRHARADRRERESKTAQELLREAPAARHQGSAVIITKDPVRQ